MTRRAAMFLFPFVALAAVWELLARSGWFPPALAPTLATIVDRAWILMSSGILFLHLGASVARLLTGYVAGSILGIAVGIAMGRSAAVERFCLPLLSLGLPIPSIALVPLFVLWFGLGNTSAILLVAFVASLQVVYNTWTGVKTTNPLWLRVGGSMNATQATILRKIVLPAAFPFILTGLRLGLARGWIGTVAGEMVSTSSWGLGWMIFNALQFLQTSTMLIGLITIGIVGYVIEKLAFQPVERRTVIRWGMLLEQRAADRAA
ncbi:MAG: ABC transporter permease [Candidatus Rokubacteria bacterium]|nr:ABC transporter permease [Candidatus Rokubacteria bacterium]